VREKSFGTNGILKCIRRSVKQEFFESPRAEEPVPAIASLEDLKAAQEKGLSIYALLYVYPPKPLDLRSLGVGGWRRRTLPVLRSPARWDAGGCFMLLCGHGHVYGLPLTPCNPRLTIKEVGADEIYRRKRKWRIQVHRGFNYIKFDVD
jgi:hypothetical protein